MARKREKVWYPKFEDSFEKTARALARKHIWRVRRNRPEMDEDDLFQELAIKFLQLKDKYPKVSNPKHFMGLCKPAWSNLITDLACGGYRKNNGRMQPEPIQTVSVDSVDCVLGMHDLGLDEVELRILLEEAPEPVRLVVEAVQQTGRGGYRKLTSGLRETRRQLLSRLLRMVDKLNRDGRSKRLRISPEELSAMFRSCLG